MKKNVSIYQGFKDSTSQQELDLEIFLDNIRTGQWQDQIIKVRAAKSKEEKKEYKSSLSSITTSGTFSKRTKAGIKKHSGFICIDIDDCDANEVKAQICTDDYIYAAFTSCSGHGVAAIYKINPDKHEEAFLGLSQYLYKNHDINIDEQCKDVTRLRAASWDPDIYINEKAKKFCRYIKASEKTKIPKKKVIYVKSDFDYIIKQIVDSNIDITSNYYAWIRIGFALNKHFGTAGEDYFHLISQQHPEYDHSKTSRKYKNLGTGDAVNLGTIYYLAKQAGIQTQSIQTKEIIQIAFSHKRAGLSQEDSLKTFKEHSDHDIDAVKEIIPQVDKDTFPEDISEIEMIENEIRTNYDIRFNEISRDYEIKKGSTWIAIDKPQMNSISKALLRVFPKMRETVPDKVIMSEETISFNPIVTFFESNKYAGQGDLVKKLSDCIKSSIGLKGEKKELFIRRWLIGVVASVYLKHSSIMLILAGERKNTGKTYFFRNLLPKELSKYYAEEDLHSLRKDDEIKMVRKLIIMNDELDGKLLIDPKKLKNLLSKDSFYLREPYGRRFSDMKRLAVFCGTSNEIEVIPSDISDNRRLIPIYVDSINHALLNSIDKTQLWLEVYDLYRNGADHELSMDEIKLLNRHTSDFKDVTDEGSLLSKYYQKASEEGKGIWITTSEIVANINNLTGINLNRKKVAQFLVSEWGLKRTNFNRANGNRSKGWNLSKSENINESFATGPKEAEETKEETLF